MFVLYVNYVKYVNNYYDTKSSDRACVLHEKNDYVLRTNANFRTHICVDKILSPADFDQNSHSFTLISKVKDSNRIHWQVDTGNTVFIGPAEMERTGCTNRHDVKGLIRQFFTIM